MPALKLVAPVPCERHADRAGYGRCRRCDRVLCGACSSFLEQVLTCPACVRALAQEEDAVLFAAGDTPHAYGLALALGVCGTIVALYAMTLVHA